ncbi:hypothetical protein EBU24_05875 [bacterium]|nr:hypothetical protein [bacterium]
MAATGLLGINPYQKGLNLDITSKPANLAIQLEQKEQAKREALDKYFMDYEKANITFVAYSKILPGEELLVNYNGEEEDTTPVWFH